MIKSKNTVDKVEKNDVDQVEKIMSNKSPNNNVKIVHCDQRQVEVVNQPTSVKKCFLGPKYAFWDLNMRFSSILKKIAPKSPEPHKGHRPISSNLKI